MSRKRSGGPLPYRGRDVMVTSWQGLERAETLADRRAIAERLAKHEAETAKLNALSRVVRVQAQSLVARILEGGDRREMEACAFALDGVRVELMMESARIQLTSDYCTCRTGKACRPRCACSCHKLNGHRRSNGKSG